MFKCDECGSIFSSPKVWHEKHGFVSPPYETFSGCPCCCGGFFEVKPCKICGEYDAMNENEVYCDNCKEKVSDKFTKLISDNFSNEEKLLLCDVDEMGGLLIELDC